MGVLTWAVPPMRLVESDDERQHRVCVDDFSIGKYEVKVSEFSEFVEASGYRTEAEKGEGCAVWTGSNWKYNKANNWRNPGFAQGQDHPVVCVDWNDAVAYAKWLSEETGKRYRLPTEAEWEYAARGGSTSKYYFGNSESELCDYGNGADESTDYTGRNTLCSDGYGQQTAPVGSFKRNPYGLYDMIGNVWEWTCSVYDEDYGGTEKVVRQRG